MANKSDHTQPRTDIYELLPEVIRSDVNQSVFETSFDRHLTKDESVHVVGFVGQSNPNALINRQIPETTPNRQAFQLQPTLYTKIGTVEYVRSYESLRKELTAMGVDSDRLPEWGNALKFNWVPPIDIDKLINYRNYYWQDSTRTIPANYITIENRCGKAQAKVDAYNKTLSQKGDTLAITQVSLADNSFTVDGSQTDLFIEGFVFYTTNTVDPNLTSKYWTVTSSSYDNTTGTTTAVVLEDIAIRSDTTPVASFVGQWWYNTSTNQAKKWDGSAWQPIAIVQLVACDISLVELLSVFQQERNCSCSGDFGWDANQWDDNQVGSVVWNTALLASISSPTAPVGPALYDLWYDTTNDQLKQWDAIVGTGTAHVTPITPGTAITALPAGTYSFDVTVDGGALQQLTVTTTGGEPYTTLAALLNATPVIGATVAYADNVGFVFTSTTPGSTSTVVVAAGTGPSAGGDFWAALALADAETITFTSTVPMWATVQSNFSAIITRTVGTYFWDKAQDCTVSIDNQWSEENLWASRLQLASTSGYRAATMPILEYNASVERNAWYTRSSTWKYRTANGYTFTTTSLQPTLLELDSVSGFEVVGNQIYLYLGVGSADDVDLTDVFVPGFVFTIRDDVFRVEPYTVVSSVFRELTPGSDQMVTIVTVAETIDAAFTKGGKNATASPAEVAQNARIEPLNTSAGDFWRGYNVHWLFVEEQQAIPATGQCTNPLLDAEESTSTLTATVSNALGVVTEAKYFQDWSLGVAGVTSITFSAVTYAITYDAAQNNIYAIAGSDDLRVYVNGVRQYGTYEENTSTVDNRTFVTGVTFTEPLSVGDDVRFEVGSKANDDMGRYVVPVRTIESDTDYAAAVGTGTQPEYISLTQYHYNEQVKLDANQYPLFNIYNVDTGEVIEVSPIITYRTSQDAAVDSRVGQRIVVSSNGLDFEFESHLIAEDDGEVYAYRDYDRAVSTYWYNPDSGVLKMWDGESWCEKFTVVVDEGGSVITNQTPVISSTEPSYLLVINGAIWYDPTANELWQRDTATSAWTALATPYVGTVDQGLRTIWRHGTNMEQYVPDYVDGNRNPVTVGDPSGDWEIPDQLYYNSEHKNRKYISYSEFFTHFTSIINKQAPIPGILGSAVFAYNQADYDYALGGTIQEHNDSYDTMLSAVNVQNATPITILEFAEEQYSSSLLSVRELFNKYAVELMSNTSLDSLAAQDLYIATDLINRYEQNEYTALLYHDTSAFDPVTGIGVANWVATLPMFGLNDKVQPELLTDRKLGIVELVHHDGHRSQVDYTAGEIDRLARLIVSSPDARVSPANPLGRISASAPPATRSDFVAQYGDISRVGVYWYRFGSGYHILYRFSPISVGSTAPSFVDSHGNEYPDGTFWYNGGTNTLYYKQGLSWTVVTAVGDGIITAAWEEVDIDELVAFTLLQIEQRLYDVTPVYDPLVFDFAGLTPTPEEQSYYNAYLYERFEQYARDRGITSPLAATTFSSADAFTWNYTYSTLSDNPKVGGLPTDITVPGDWRELYQRLYGTPYPHLEPWKLQGYTAKPSWWDTEYKDPTGARRWIFTPSGSPVYNPSLAANIGTGMWQNIYAGIIPVGYTAPDGSPGTGLPNQVTRWYYFSVNTSDTVLTGGYNPDDVLPPFYSTTDPLNRAPFTDYSVQISRESADYIFGNVGPVEYEWLVSSEHVYDLQIVAFRMQPVRYLHYALGVEFIEVDSLQIDKLFRQVYSHEDAKFHGDLYNTSSTFLARGLNQWYVDYNRYRGYDTNDEFRSLWVNWNPLLTYQFGGTTDTSSFQITTKNFDLTKADYNIVLDKDSFFNDVWLDTFRVAASYVPPSTIAYNNQNEWRFDLDTQAPIARAVTYYGVHNYPFVVDTVNNKGTINQFTIADSDPANGIFYFVGDQTQVFAPANVQFTITGSIGNDGTWTVVSAVYDPTLGQTAVTVVEQITSPSLTGVVDIISRVLPWNTGDPVLITTTYALPAPLTQYTTYYVIRLSDTEFQLAATVAEALANTPIVLTSKGTGQLSIGQMETTFFALGDTRYVWYHYAVDRNDVRTFTPVASMTGIQTLVNIFDGYAAYQLDSGIVVGNTELAETDPATGRTIGWQIEIERFIAWTSSVRSYNSAVRDKYGFAVDVSTDICTFLNTPPAWTTGTKVLITGTGTLPTPLIANTPYYIVRDVTDTTKFQLSVSPNTSNTSNIIDFLALGSGSVYIEQYEPKATYPVFEVNPNRNNVWINTPQGIVGNILTPTIEDVQVQQIVHDQYGRQLPASDVTALRQDKQMRIFVKAGLANDVEPQQILAIPNEYNYLHIGGGHFFIDAYEHVILFNDYTTEGDLVYDQFLGLNTARIDLDFYKQEGSTFRPVLGGYYLKDSDFYRNMEGSADDIRYLYDTYNIPETNPIVEMARSSIGYDGPKTYLEEININDKSQFLFWKGMIQAKGSVNSVNAFINSRRFVDAKLDEFWAYKVAEFGDARVQIYPTINVSTADLTENDIRLLFLGAGDSSTAFTDDLMNGFEPISINDQTRWDDYPDQKAALNNTALFLDAGATSKEVVLVSATQPPVGQEDLVDYWYDTGAMAIKAYNPLILDPTAAWEVVDHKANYDSASGLYIYHLAEIADDIRVVRQIVEPTDLRQTSSTTVLSTGDYEQINSEVVKIGTTFSQLLTIFTLNPLTTKLNPAKIIDTKSQAVVSDVTFWDPARGVHFYRAAHNIDLFNDVDPAKYNTTHNGALYASNQAWDANEVGTIWLDTSRLGYLPYYDAYIKPNINDRLAHWGNLADWADVRVFQWTESPVPPDQWAAVVAQDAANSSIPFNQKRSGTPRTTVFRRTRTAYAFDPSTDVDTVNDIITLPTSIFSIGSAIVFGATDTSNGQLPAPLVAGTVYYVVDVPGADQIKVSDTVNGTPIDLTSVGANGSGQLQVVPEWTDGMWFRVSMVHQRFMAAIEFGLTTLPGSPTLTLGPDFEPGDTVKVYVNGQVTADAVTITVDGSNQITFTPDVPLTNIDIIDVVRPDHVVSPQEQNAYVDTETADDGTTLIQWTSWLETTTRTLLNENNAAQTLYYFWVEQKTERDETVDNSLSLAEIVNDLTSAPDPTLVVQTVVTDGFGTGGYGVILYGDGSELPTGLFAPAYYQHAVVRGVSTIVRSDDRYVVRFTRDFTLRDDLNDAPTPNSLKKRYVQWQMFREEQTYKVNQTLWNRMIEAIIGYKLSDNTARVPTLDRELYDMATGSDTRFGLGPDQAFVDGTLALATILNDLEDPNNNFYPTDINQFFALYSFDTPANITTALQEIYSSFATEDVNRIYFKVLQDAFSVKSKYAEIFKTSWVSLYGVRVLEVNGIFDD